MSDYISREQAIEEVCEFYTTYERKEVFIHTTNMIKQAVADLLSELPSADVRESKTGRWILQTHPNSKLYGWYICSECGAFIGCETNFCSECGADMRGKHEIEN